MKQFFRYLWIVFFLMILPGLVAGMFGIAKHVIGWVYLPIAIGGMLAFINSSRQSRESRDKTDRRRHDANMVPACAVAILSGALFAVWTHPRADLEVRFQPGLLSSEVTVQNKSANTFVAVSGIIRVIDAQGKFSDTPITWDALYPQEVKSISVSRAFAAAKVQFLAPDTSARGYFFDTDLLGAINVK